MEGSATSSSLQVLCSSSSSAGGGGGGGGTHHHLLQFIHQSRVARFPGSSPGGVRLTTTSTTTLGKAATATGTARCGSKGVSLDSTKDPPHGGGGEEEEQGRWVEKLMGENIGRDKCKDDEGKGLAALLECLEREAIMGDDNGKQPTDYNRRAQIFDRSSRFFQDHHHPSPP